MDPGESFNERRINLLPKDRPVVNYIIRGHGALNGEFFNINQPETNGIISITTYTKIGTYILAQTPLTDITICNGEVNDYDGQPFEKQEYNGYFPDFQISCWGDSQDKSAEEKRETDDVKHSAGLYICTPLGKQFQPGDTYPYFLIKRLSPERGCTMKLSEFIKMIYEKHTHVFNFQGKINNLIERLT